MESGIEFKQTNKQKTSQNLEMLPGPGGVCLAVQMGGLCGCKATPLSHPEVLNTQGRESSRKLGATGGPPCGISRLGRDGAGLRTQVLAQGMDVCRGIPAAEGPDMAKPRDKDAVRPLPTTFWL